MAKNELVPVKQQAVDLWRKTRGNITLVCQAMKMSRATYYNWLKGDKDFQRAIMDCEAEVNDDVRDALMEKIAGGDMTGIIFYLKKRHPDFKEADEGGARHLHFHQHLENQRGKYEV